MTEVKTRFAPSPTGFLHIGGARTALYSWLYARHNGGKFVLRIEDTDRVRSTKEATDAIIESMKWLGLDWDEGPFYQTKRFDRYNAVIDDMLAKGLAYKCYCTKERIDALREEQQKKGEKPRYDGHCRDDHSEHSPDEPYVVRFRNPTEDDADMGITHVIRGEDHINNTPRQINIYKALGLPVPEFAHVSMILGDDGTKLSKRHGAVGVMQYRDDGYLPEALINYLVRLGWGHGDQEIFTLDEMIKLFNVENVSKSASAFNTKKLMWMNQQYMKMLPPEHVAEYLKWHMDNQKIDLSNGPALPEIVKAFRERTQTLKEMAEKSRYFYEEYKEIDPKAAKKWFKSDSADALERVKAKFEALSDWNADELQKILEGTAAEMGVGMGKVCMPLRVAVTGGAVSPEMNVVLELVGKERVLSRVSKVIELLKAKAAEQPAEA